MPRLLTAKTDRIGPLAFYALRSLERRLLPSSLHSLLTPLAFARAVLARRPSLPGYFRRSSLPRAGRKAQMNYFLSRAIEFFPDQLATTKWQPHFKTNGLHHIKEARKNGRPVVLVCFHFGVYKLIPFWLRALGIPVVALIGGRSAQRSRAKQMKDRLSPFPSMPTVLYTTDQLRNAIELLSAGNVLLLAADREASKQVTVPINDEWSFRMAVGAIRMASHCDAELIPCCMTDTGHWNFCLEIGRPVPREFLANEFDTARVAEHLLQEMLAKMRNHPEQCSRHLLDCFTRNVPSAVAESVLP